jgi:hypothetical protein
VEERARNRDCSRLLVNKCHVLLESALNLLHLSAQEDDTQGTTKTCSHGVDETIKYNRSKLNAQDSLHPRDLVLEGVVPPLEPQHVRRRLLQHDRLGRSSS